MACSDADSEYTSASDADMIDTSNIKKAIAMIEIKELEDGADTNIIEYVKAEAEIIIQWPMSVNEIIDEMMQNVVCLLHDRWLTGWWR